MNTRQKVSFRVVRVNSYQPSMLVVGLLLCLFSAGCMKTIEPPVAPAAPAASARIATAKTVFVSNLGADMWATKYLPNGANDTYNAFYALLKKSGPFSLVGSPKGADLIFEVYTTDKETTREQVPLTLGNHNSDWVYNTSPAVVTLTVKDAATLNVLWTTQYNITLYGNSKKGVEQHLMQQMNGLISEVDALTPSSAAMPGRSE